MAPKGMKRPAAAAKAEPKKKARVAAAPVVDYSPIIDALMAAEELPQQVRSMLGANVENTLSVPKDKRHPFQERVIIWISEAFNTIHEGMQRRIAAAEVKVADADSEKAKRLQAENEAQEAKLARMEELIAKKEAATAADAEKKLAIEALNEASRAQKNGERDIEKTLSEKALLEDCLENAFAQLKAGGLDESEAKQKLEVLLAAAKDLDQSMLTSLPSALRKDPSSRGTFDNMVVDSVEEELKKRISGAAEVTTNADAVRRDWADKVEAAQAAQNAASEASAAAHEAVKAAQAETVQANAAAKTAVQSMKQFVPDMKAAGAALDAEKHSLSAFSEGALALFRELEASVSPEFATERAAEAEAAAAAEAEAEAARKAAEAKAADGEGETAVAATTADVLADAPGAAA